MRVSFLRTSRREQPARDFAHLSGVARICADRQQATLSKQIAIAEIAAPTGQEEARATAIHSWLSEIHLTQVRRDAVGNVIALIAATEAACDERAPVVVLAHLDTVCVGDVLPSTRREGDRLVLPGIGDNGRGLAALLELSTLLGRDDLSPYRARPIELVATVGEEGLGDLRGVRTYFADRARAGKRLPHAAIALDGTGADLIVHHAIASRRLRISVDGPGGHPWADADAANAIHVASRAIAAICRMADAQSAGVTVSVTRMGGGESLTAIPAHAWFEIDMRALDTAAIPRLHEAVRRLVERSVSDAALGGGRDNLRFSIETLGDRPGGTLDAAHPLICLAADATRWQGGEPRSASASSDANIPLSLGVPAITIGAGGVGGGAHTIDEWYEDTSGARGMARVMAIVTEVARVHHAEWC